MQTKYCQQDEGAPSRAPEEEQGEKRWSKRKASKKAAGVQEKDGKKGAYGESAEASRKSLTQGPGC